MALIEGTEHRSKEVQDAARRFEIDHLQDPDMRQIGMSSARYAGEMLMRIRRDDAELVRALTSLADARDAFMRALAYEKRI